MNDSVLAGLYRKHADLAESFNRTRHHEQIAIRSVNGGVYPTGVVGQALFDFAIGAMFFWNGSAWIPITPGGPWTAVTYTAGWVDLGGGFRGAQYRKVGDEVQLRGLCKRTSGSATTMFTLPVGYRPTVSELFAQLSNDLLARIQIDLNGEVILSFGAPTAWVNLSGISFSAT